MKRKSPDNNYSKPGKINKTTTIDCSVLSVQHGIPDCKGMIDLFRIFESRSACMWNFLSRRIGTNNVFSNMLTIPIITSFLNDSDAKRVIETTVDAMSNGMFNDTETDKQQIFIDNIIKLSLKLRNCNMAWNRNTPDINKITYKLNPEVVFLNKKYSELIRNSLFLQEIMGVINKDSFVEGTQYYVVIKNGKEELADVDPKLDKFCRQKSNSQCSQEPRCVVRTSSTNKKSCVSVQRHRSIKSGNSSSYYIQEAPNEIVYKPLCLYYIVSGNAGIFRQYKPTGKRDVLRKTKRVSIVFPPFGDDFKSSVSGFMVYYWGGYIQDINAKANGHSGSGKVGVQIGLWKWINSWYDSCVTRLEQEGQIDPDHDHIYVTGVSLGGALANLASFKLLQRGYKYVHMYAMGAPRVGDENFNQWMNNCNLQSDSANYVRFVNVVKDNKFYTEFDPVAKFPPNQMSFWDYTGYGNLRFVDNPRIRLIGGGMTFNPVFKTFTTQPEYDMLPFAHARRLFINNINKLTPIGGDCENNWGFIHSISAYSAMVLNGQNIYDGIDSTKPHKQRDYYASFSAIRNLNDAKCK